MYVPLQLSAAADVGDVGVFAALLPASGAAAWPSNAGTFGSRVVAPAAAAPAAESAAASAEKQGLQKSALASRPAPPGREAVSPAFPSCCFSHSSIPHSLCPSGEVEKKGAGSARQSNSVAGL